MTGTAQLDLSQIMYEPRECEAYDAWRELSHSTITLGRGRLLHQEDKLVSSVGCPVLT
jgi:hypothetical protein